MILPILQTEPVLCNKCGECCRHGGVCMLRGRTWSGLSLQLVFDGICELLNSDSTCSTMNRISNQKNNQYLRAVGINGTCDFPQLRLDSPPVVC